MATSGFEYIAQPIQFELGTNSLFPRPGDWTLEQAEEIGFGFSHPPKEYEIDFGVDESATEQEQQAYFEEFSRCMRVAKQEVNGSYQVEIEPIRESYEDLLRDFDATVEVVALDKKWSQCMLETGYDTVPQSFGLFAQHYLDDYNAAFGAAVSNGELPPDDELNELRRSEHEAAIDAVKCAAPLKDQYNNLWLEYQREFDAQHEIPEMPG